MQFLVKSECFDGSIMKKKSYRLAMKMPVVSCLFRSSLFNTDCRSVLNVIST